MSDIKSKEDFLREAYERKYSSPTYDKSVNKQANFDYISPAMDEYAKQQSINAFIAAREAIIKDKELQYKYNTPQDYFNSL